MNLFQSREEIGKNLTTFIRLKGYSKSSFSKLTGISRPTLNLMLSGSIASSTTFETHIKKITDTLNISRDYFLQKPNITLETWQQPSIQYSDRAEFRKREEQVQKVLDDLDDLLDIAALYL
ncbi:helix-turn-helix transcriptional regulator [Priestia megaterium]|uniref:helix-turn-helix domain-containing protein n=1 Tax=Priestia megaterium TaxID=1404 RepID=UPI001C2197EC|nr:helix-turn-helix transcriptional regulator [Priestia megaterium]MBU8757313.1 helix-turn-helix transcriptional regulator [Priestia megaterium]